MLYFLHYLVLEHVDMSKNDKEDEICSEYNVYK